MSKARFVVATIVSFVLLAGGFGLATPAKASNQNVFHVQMGATSPDMAIASMSFYPASISIHTGDVIVFTSPSLEPHTVTFGAPSDTFLNIFDYLAPFGGTVFTGQPLNSGFLTSDPSFPFGTTVSITFDVPPGTYSYRCTIHPVMKGLVTVLPNDQRLPFADQQYTSKARGQMTSDLAQGRSIFATSSVAAMHGSDIGGTGIEVAIGGAVGVSSAMRFFPSALKVHVGTTVTFVNRDYYTPHTVTFGPEPPGAPFSLIAPYGNPANFDGTTPLNSGFLYTPLPFGLKFSVTFTAPGTFDYKCGLHDVMGMLGSVTVVA